MEKIILFVTARCDGECSHCLHRCTNQGEDMSNEILMKSIKLIKKIKPFVITVSGGEPSLHPEIINIANTLKKELPNTHISLISNGSFLKNDSLTKELKKTFRTIQITYDKRYYPNFVDLKKAKSLSILTEDNIRRVDAYGRAIDNNIVNSDRKSPYCFNIRSCIKLSGLDLCTANKTLEMQHKFCACSIRPNGDIGISESMLCPIVGTINNSIEEITFNIRNFKCKECIYAKKLYSKGLPYAAVF